MLFFYFWQLPIVAKATLSPNLDGIMVDQDEKKAFGHYFDSAEIVNVNAQFMVGKMFHHRKGTEKNLRFALKFYRLAEDQGNGEAALAAKELEMQLR